MPPKPEKPTPDELREIGSRLGMIQEDLRLNKAVAAFEKVTHLREFIDYIAAKQRN